MALLLAAGACREQAPNGLVLIKGGTVSNKKSGFYGKELFVRDYYIGKYEVTQAEWVAVMGSNPSSFKGEDLPVESVSWYDCIEYCNQRSGREGLSPYYQITRSRMDPDNTDELDDLRWSVTIDTTANGYRLPTEVEWEYAASGGRRSKGFVYPGGDDIDALAWYWKNAGDQYLSGFWSWPSVTKNHNRTRPVGGKRSNELGIYDMAGNVREWCWDGQPADSSRAIVGRIWKGGGWIGADFCCTIAFRAAHQANGKGPDQGFRVCRNIH